jgi:hypothetical protein
MGICAPLAMPVTPSTNVFQPLRIAHPLQTNALEIPQGTTLLVRVTRTQAIVSISFKIPIVSLVVTQPLGFVKTTHALGLFAIIRLGNVTKKQGNAVKALAIMS